mmetsp:Transcript_8087/g.17403  ORF Transcript_8087/g.17403 Transcript_8087/m.17403 type:complete len:338 (-) Transcript_8087:55-1068(-)
MFELWEEAGLKLQGDEEMAEHAKAAAFCAAGPVMVTAAAPSRKMIDLERIGSRRACRAETRQNTRTRLGVGTRVAFSLSMHSNSDGFTTHQQKHSKPVEPRVATKHAELSDDDMLGGDFADEEEQQSSHDVEFLDDLQAETNPLEGGRTSSATCAEVFGPLESDPLLPVVHTVARAGDDRKARDIVAMRVSPLTVVTSFLVFLSAASAPQLRAVVNNVEAELARVHDGMKPTRVSGTADSGWMLLDYGDVMVHVFHAQQRAFYSLETRWAAGERVDLSSIVLAAPTTAVTGARASASHDTDHWDIDGVFAVRSDVDGVSGNEEDLDKEQKPLEENWI